MAPRSAQHRTLVGYETMNEPSPGYIGCHALNQVLESQPLKLHETPTPFQGMVLARFVAVQWPLPLPPS